MEDKYLIHLEKLKSKYKPRDIVVVDPEIWSALKEYIPTELGVNEDYVIQEESFKGCLALVRA